jgi:fucose permease
MAARRPVERRWHLVDRMRESDPTMTTSASAGSAVDARMKVERDGLVWFLFLSLGLFGFMQGFLSAAMPFLKDSLALTTSVVSWHFSAYALGRLSSGFAARRLVDREVGPGAVRLTGLVLLVVMIGVALAPSRWLTLPGALSVGFFGGLLQALTQAQFARLPSQTRSIAIGEAYVVASLGVFLCPVSIGFVADQGAPWMTALAIPAMILAANALFLRFSERAASAPKPAARTRKGAARMKAVGTFWLLVFCGNAVEWGIGLWGPQVLKDKLHLETSSAVSLMGFYFGATIVGRVINTRLLRRFECEQLFLAYIALGWAAVVVLFVSTSLPVAAGALIVSGACLGCFYPLNLATAMKYAPDDISLITSGAAKCSGLALLTVPLTLGYASDHYGLSTAIFVLGGIPPIMAGFLLNVLRDRRHSAESAPPAS